MTADTRMGKHHRQTQRQGPILILALCQGQGRRRSENPGVALPIRPPSRLITHDIGRAHCPMGGIPASLFSARKPSLRRPARLQQQKAAAFVCFTASLPSQQLPRMAPCMMTFLLQIDRHSPKRFTKSCNLPLRSDTFVSAEYTFRLLRTTAQCENHGFPPANCSCGDQYLVSCKLPV